MRKTLRAFLPALVFLTTVSTSAQSQEPVFLFEVQAAVAENAQPHTFQVFGDKESGSFTAYGIQVVPPTGEVFMLDEFEAILPSNSEADALVIEDVNFDGYADVRFMQYLTGGSLTPFYYWIYDPSTEKFTRAESFDVVKNPHADHDKRLLVSQQKVSAEEVITEFYDPQGQSVTLVRKEVRNYAADGSSKLHVFVIKDGANLHLMETRDLAPGEN